MAFLFDAGIFSVEGLSGEILPGTKLYWYESGTSTPLATYSNEALTTPNANPVLSDSEGRFPSIWLQDASYKLVMELPNGTQRTRDPIRNPGDGVFPSFAALASDTPGKGRDLIGEPTVAQMLASTAPARGAGSIWHARGRYKEAAPSATDHDFVTAGGVKLYAPRDRDGRVYLTPEMFGIYPDLGDAFASTNAARLELLRVRAEANKAKVEWSRGEYTLPEGIRLDARDTEWIFPPGAILKLHSLPVINQDFITFDRPVRQIVRNFQFDANRAAQNPNSFGSDRCGTRVVSPTDCLFDGVEVISSPGKGFGVVSAAGETSSGTDVRNVRGGNCATQAVIFDANNSTGFFSNCTLDDVRIGVTSHAGVAINDGVADCTISNIYCDVGLSSVWDAVAFRDVSKLKIKNVTGKGGRHGVHFQLLNTFCGDFDLESIHGENSNGSGVLFTAVKRVNGTKITGVNNADAGVNLARVPADDKRCEDIHLTGVTGIDTRGVPDQDYGILLGGTRRCSIKDWTATGNTVENAWLVVAVNEKSFIEWEQEFSAAIPSQAANALFDFSIPLTGVPFLAEYIAIRVPPILNCGTSLLALAAAGQEVAFNSSIYTAKGRNQSGTTAWEGVARVVIGSKR